MSGYLVVLVTAGSEEAAAEIARVLVGERLAACGNIVPRIRSIYRWEGAVHDEGEALLVLKTRAEMFERLRERVVGLHSYKTPEVVALTVADGHAPYLEWLAACTAPDENEATDR